MIDFAMYCTLYNTHDANKMKIIKCCYIRYMLVVAVVRILYRQITIEGIKYVCLFIALLSVWVSAGIITLSKWCEAMETATHLGLPWRLLREKLAPIQPDVILTDVHYALTLQMLDTDLIVSTRTCTVVYLITDRT